MATEIFFHNVLALSTMATEIYEIYSDRSSGMATEIYSDIFSNSEHNGHRNFL
jgi:hypothetical protein